MFPTVTRSKYVVVHEIEGLKNEPVVLNVEDEKNLKNSVFSKERITDNIGNDTNSINVFHWY